MTKPISGGLGFSCVPNIIVYLFIFRGLGYSRQFFQEDSSSTGLLHAAVGPQSSDETCVRVWGSGFKAVGS